MASFALKVTQFGFSTLGLVSPKAAGALAFSLFCRTPSRRTKGPKAQATFKAGAELLAGAERAILQTPSGKIAAYRLVSMKERAPRVLVVHGWGSRAEFLADLAAGIHQGGAEVILIDLPGHGRSSGRLLNMRIAAEAIAAAQGHFGPFDGVVGHSFGGASVMTAAGGIFADVAALDPGTFVLIGAPSEIQGIFNGFAEHLKLTIPVRRALIAHAERVLGRTVDAFDTVPIAQRLARPVLVIHAEDDKEVSVDHARRFLGENSPARVLWANGYGHRRIVSAPDVISHVARFLMESDVVADNAA
ncbi:MAG: alpha/beta hydrolase [Allorhizobium sp.]